MHLRIVSISIALLVLTGHASAEPATDGLTTKFTIDDRDPESHIPNAQEALAAPLQMGYWVMLVSDRADAALQRKDYLGAARYYRAIAKAVPDRAVGFKHACRAYETAGDFVQATPWCRQALDKEGATADDYATFVRVSLAQPNRPDASALAELDATLDHLQSALREADRNASDNPAQAPSMSASQGRAFVERLRCDVAVRMADERRLARCTNELAKVAPSDPRTLGFRFTHALAQKRFDDAQALVTSARSLGMPASGIALMKQRLEQEREREPFLRRVLPRSPSVALLLLGLLGATLATYAVTRRRLA